jgi:hypothetical protein
VPTFPNLFLIVGPNMATGHASLLFAIEVQVNLIAQLITPILRREVAAVAITRDVCATYNDKIQRRLAGTNFMQCSSWYRLDMTGVNFAIFPGPMALLWWWARKPVWSRYELVGGEAWLRARRRRQFTVSVLWVIGLLLIASVIFHPALLKRVPYIQTPAFVQTVDFAQLWVYGLWERIR